MYNNGQISLREAKRFIKHAQRAVDDLAAQFHLKGREMELPACVCTLRFMQDVAQDVIIQKDGSVSLWEYRKASRRFWDKTYTFWFDASKAEVVIEVS